MEFRERFWLLVRLRYRLIWSQARTSNGRMAIFFALYALGGIGFLFFSLGGFGMAQSALLLGQEERVARWALTAFFANGIGLSFLFGLGTRGAFSEESLRHYPLNSRERFIVRHGIGLLDPIWLIVAAGSLGLALGLTWAGIGSIVMGLPAVFLFVSTCYLMTATLLSLADRVVETRNGAALFSALVILVVSFGPLAIASVLTSHRFDVWTAFDRFLQLTPPGAAAWMMAGDDPIKVLGGAFLSFLWCAALAYFLLKFETRPQPAPSVVERGARESGFDEQITKVLGERYGPLVSKSLRYHLRSNLIRFSLITSPLIVLLGKYLPLGPWQAKFFPISLAIFFILSSAAGATLMLNLFGFDDSGIRRYALLPIPFADALRASSLASLLLRAVALLVAMALWLLFYAEESLSWQILAIIAGTALGSMVLFNALGLWTSIFSPKRLNFDALWNSRLSLGANLVLFIGIAIFWGILFVGIRIDPSSLMLYWWVSPMILIFCSGFYILSLAAVSGPLKARRERLINLIAGAGDK